MNLFSSIESLISDLERQADRASSEARAIDVEQKLGKHEREVSVANRRGYAAALHQVSALLRVAMIGPNLKDAQPLTEPQRLGQEGDLDTRMARAAGNIPTPAQAEPVAWHVTYANGRKVVLTEPDPEDWLSVTPLYAHPPAPPQDREAVARCIAIVREVRDGFLSPDYATDQPVSSFNERFACDQVASAIEDEFAMGTAEQRALLGGEEREERG